MVKELLIKYIEGECTEDEKVIVTNWLESSSENMKEYVAMRKLYDITIWQTQSAVIPALNSKDKTFFRSLRPVYTEIMKIAAIFAIALAVSHFLFRDSGDQYPVAMQTIHIPAGQRAQITLADGTNVWLNARTTLTVPGQFTGNTREVKLDGEGYFEVSSDKAKPFIVKTERYSVKVLGTTFNLSAYSGENTFETSLLEGTVEIMKPGDSKGIVLKPNERAFSKDDLLVVDQVLYSSHFLWRDGIISVENESFPELVNKLERFFNMKITVMNEDIMEYRCTGKFRTIDGVEHILKVLQLSNNFKYTINEKQSTITIE